MCCGTPTNGALRAVSFDKMLVQAKALQLERKPAACPPEEEQCGTVGKDGVRRFSYRRVLCRGAEVLVHGWLAVVESIDMDAETVVIRYTAGATVRTVPLKDVRSVLVDPLNRDLQKGIQSLSDTLTNFFDLKNWIGGCPMGMMGQA